MLWHSKHILKVDLIFSPICIYKVNGMKINFEPIFHSKRTLNIYVKRGKVLENILSKSRSLGSCGIFYEWWKVYFVGNENFCAGCHQGQVYINLCWTSVRWSRNILPQTREKYLSISDPLARADCRVWKIFAKSKTEQIKRYLSNVFSFWYPISSCMGHGRNLLQ